MKTIFVSLAALLSAANSMNAPNSCRTVQVTGGEACIKARGNAFWNWITTEDGYTLCSHLKGGKEVFTYANGTGTNGFEECSDIELKVGRARGQNPLPSNILPGILPGRFVPEEEEHRGSESSFFRQLAGDKFRSLQAGPVKLKNLVILLQWSDDQGKTEIPSKEVYESLMSGKAQSPVIPTGSVTDVFNSNLYGKVEIETTVVGWVTSRYTHKQAAGVPPADATKGCGGTCNPSAMLRTAISEALQQIDGTLVNIGDYDGNKDGVIDLFTIIHSGHGAETMGGTGAARDWIWSHKWVLPNQYVSKTGNVKVTNYNINPGLWSVSGFEPTRIGVVSHESFHFLGLPDLYDSDYSSIGIGEYGLMANSWGLDGSQQYPPSLSAWSKVELGIIKPIEITESGVYSIDAVQNSAEGTVYKLPMRNEATGTTHRDYILIENRQPTGFDKLLNGGILMWHVDPAKTVNSKEGYPGSPGWPQTHYKVRLIQADGRFDMEKGQRDQTAGDWFFKGNGPASADINDLSTPSLNGYQFMAQNACSGHKISDISVSGAKMTFTYTKMAQDCSGREAPSKSPTNAPTQLPTNPSGNGIPTGGSDDSKDISSAKDSDSSVVIIAVGAVAVVAVGSVLFVRRKSNKQFQGQSQGGQPVFGGQNMVGSYNQNFGQNNQQQQSYRLPDL